MKGVLITFEGTEGSGKSTHVQLLAERLRTAGRTVRVLREPGGTPIGEEIRHTLKHSQQNHAMTAETELLLMNASRAQLVREVIRPALTAGEAVLCDRYFDSTIAYQGYGRRLDLKTVRAVVDFAVGQTRPDLTFLLSVPIEVSEARRLARQQAMLLDLPPRGQKPEGRATPAFSQPLRDRMEEADRDFFGRVEDGYKAIAAAEPRRVCVIDSTQPLETVKDAVWQRVEPLLAEAISQPASR
ncbi:MAG: dTMP kinase [Verrucomicrobia bacterium]|nr:MAG: dTMP kinase [Verrucomicrobiota bacterium]